MTVFFTKEVIRIAFFAIVLIVIIVCATIIILQHGKNKRRENDNSTAINIAQIVSTSDKNANCEIITKSLDAKMDNAGCKISYKPKSEEDDDILSKSIETTILSKLSQLLGCKQ